MLKKYLSSFFGQGIVSLFMFVVNVLMIRTLEPVDFAFFALIIIVVIASEGIQNALINTPLSVHIPAFTRRAPQAIMELVFSSINTMFLVVVFVCVFAFALLSVDIGQYRIITAIGTAVFATAWLVRSYVRGFLFAHLKSETAAIADVIFILLGSLAYPVLRAADDGLALAVVYLFLSAGLILGTITALRLYKARVRMTLRFRVLRRYRVPWLDARWALVGVIATVLSTQAHALIVTSALGPEAFAALAAGAVLFGPLRVLMNAWGTITRPYLAMAVSRDNINAVKRINRLAFSALSLVLLVVLVALYHFWPDIESLIYRDKYKDMSLIVSIWAIVAVLASCRILLSIPLQSMRAFKKLAYVAIVSAVISLLGVWILMTLISFEYSILGIALAEIVALLSIFYYYEQELMSAASAIASRATDLAPTSDPTSLTNSAN